MHHLQAIKLIRRRICILNPIASKSNSMSTKNGGDDEWNDTWETAWLPEDLTAKNRDPWETDVNYPTTTNEVEEDSETKAFVEDMNEKWDERRKQQFQKPTENGTLLYSLDNIKKDYRLKKQRIHASLWMKEIQKQQEANLGGDSPHDIDTLLDNCSQIFDSGNKNWDNPEMPNCSEYKSKPDGWETTSKPQDGGNNIWEMSQREEDILLQEFDRRIAYTKFQIASFIKTHIFSRRRPIDGWKYMIEVLGPNARKGKGSVSRIAALSDTATQPFKEERRRTINFVPHNPKSLGT